MQGVSSKTLTERLIRDAVENLTTPRAERELSRHYDDPRFCYCSDCWSAGVCHGCRDGCAAIRAVGAHMRVLDRPALDWPKTWRSYEHLACRAVGHYSGIDAVEARPGRWKRGRVAVRAIDQFLRSMGRSPACTYSARWRRRLFAYLGTDVGVAHFQRWLRQHRERHASK